MDAAARVARMWVGFYTGWVSAEAAERRRDEITSDLWEQSTDAHENGHSSAVVNAVIVHRVVTGIPADLSWVHTQRRLRSRPTERRSSLMTTTKEFVRTSWWVVTAALVAAFYVWGGVHNLLEDGQPYVDQVPVLGALALAIVIGIFLRGSRPRAAAGLIAVASAPAALIIWFPLVMVLAVVTIVGAVLELLGRSARSRVSL